MKKLFALIAVVVIAVLVVSACSTDALQNIQSHTGGDPKISNYVEARNIQWKIIVQDRTNTIEWCTFFSNQGSPLTTVAVLNKMTSGNKRLDPATTTDTGFHFSLPGEDPSVYHITNEVPAADGTYGSSNPYEFGFTPEGIDGYFQTNLMYYCSLKPLTWQTPTINLGVDEGLASKQLQAQQILQSGGCIDSQLNQTTCPAAPSPAVVPPVAPVAPTVAP